MNRKQFLTLIVLGLLVGGLGLYLYNQRKGSFAPSSFSEGAKVVKDFPLNDITHVRILQGTNEVNLVRAENWTVQERWNYPASFSELSDFLRKVWELKPVQEVEAGPSQYGRLQLLNPRENQGTNAGTLVEFKDAKGAVARSLVLGKQHMRESQGGMFGGGGEFPVGRYILVPENPPRVWLVNETFSNVQPEPQDWLNKEFFKVEKIKSVSVSYPDKPDSNWTAVRETESGSWNLQELKEGEEFEASKASSLNYALSSPTFNDVASPELKPAESGLAEPTVAALETFDGFLYTLKVGGTNEENRYLSLSVEAKFPAERAAAADEKPEDKERLDKEFNENQAKLKEKLAREKRFEGWTYLVSKWTVDSLLKERKDFLAEKKQDDTSDEAFDADSDRPPIPPIDTLPPELKNIQFPPTPGE